MKKTLIIPVLFLLALTQTVLSLPSIPYNFTFAGGSNESFTKAFGDNPTYAGNNFTTTGTTGTMVVRNIGLNTSFVPFINVTFRYRTDSVSTTKGIGIGSSDVKTKSNYNPKHEIKIWSDAIYTYEQGAFKGYCNPATSAATGTARVVFYTNKTVKVYINGVLRCEKLFGTAPSANETYFAMMSRSNAQANWIDDVYFTDYGVGPEANLTITNSTLNMTSDGGCTSWRTNQATNCLTTDGTPTVTFNTASATKSNCSLRTVSHAYNSSFKCSTTGTSVHICTIYSTDKLVFGTQSLYIGCSGFSSYGNARTVQSGPLAINMTAGGGGGGLVSCIKVIGSGCAASITNNCAVITK